MKTVSDWTLELMQGLPKWLHPTVTTTDLAQDPTPRPTLETGRRTLTEPSAGGCLLADAPAPAKLCPPTGLLR